MVLRNSGWFTTGTLCHLANSAQYALGVAIDNVARLLHIDETVLWSGAATTATQTLSENISSFEEVKVYGESHNHYPWISNAWITSSTVYGVGFQMWWNNPAELDVSRFCLSGDKITPMKGSWYSYSTAATTGTLTGNAANNSYICKVIGIGRKDNT